jgi:ABC-type xylose transport system substrate-binding protein
MIDYDRLTLKSDADYYVSGDATEAGRLQGKGLVEDLEKAGKPKPAVAILDGAPTDSFATDLKNGYNEVLDPKFKAATEASAGAGTSRSGSRTSAWSSRATSTPTAGPAHGSSTCTR